MLLKVILVDDEVLVRLGIKSIIDWEAHGFQYAGDAPDGVQALELIEQTQPDILLTDIVMPNMNGLELIEITKKKYPYIHIIVLSSHNEFDYVRTALKLGVDDYILKTSLKPEGILNLLLEVANKITLNQQEMKKKINPELDTKADSMVSFAACLRNVLENHMESCQYEDEMIEKALDYNYLLLMHIHHSGTLESYHSQAQTLFNLVELELNKWNNGFLLHFKDNEIVILLSYLDERAITADELQEIGYDLISAVHRFLGVTTSIGISRPLSGLKQYRVAYNQAKKALQNYFYDGKGKVFVGSEEEKLNETNPSKGLFSDEYERRLITALEHVYKIKIQELILEIFGQMRAEKGAIEKNIQICLELLHCFQTGFKKYGLDPFQGLEDELPLYKQILSFEELDHAEMWFDRLITVCCNRASTFLREAHREEINSLVLYMKSNYTADLSLKQAAELVNMSESYLSYLFKKEKQTSFTEYFNQIRVKKAAEYLLTTNLPSYIIAEKVGYNNINYFGRIFKKTIGVSPQNYRNRFKKIIHEPN
jgi:two-component system response regulator YesN